MAAEATIQRPFFRAPNIHKSDGTLKLSRILIANRGEIACRVIRGCAVRGIRSIAVYTTGEQDAPHAKLADEAHSIGDAENLPYTNIKLLIEVAKNAGAEAIHPGYGFLSENAEFAQAVADAGMTFIGPRPDIIDGLGDKRQAKELLSGKSIVPLVPGYAGASQDVSVLEAAAEEIGYPVMIKASAGGGGKGMRIVYEPSEFRSSFAACASEASRHFGSSNCLLEKYIEAGKHVEIQIFGDGETMLSFFDRDCSVQRRHQKIIEESPCAWLTPELREDMSRAAIALAQMMRYNSAGTVEFIVDLKQNAFYFLEVNTRLQVEHPITEEVTAVDLVCLQIYVAAGGKLSDLPSLDTIEQKGHSIEVRLVAEQPFRDFRPSSGPIELFKTCHDVTGSIIPHVRYELGVESGSEISIHHDSLIAKIVVWAHDRATAIQKMLYALQHTVCLGVHTNQSFLQKALAHPGFRDPTYDTHFIPKHKATLFAPLDTESILNSSAVVACLFFDTVAEITQAAGGAVFRSIPRNFRNQHKDYSKRHIRALTADLGVAGLDQAVEIMVATDDGNNYQVWDVPDNSLTAPTAVENDKYPNRVSGGLTKRYYTTLDSRHSRSIQATILHHDVREYRGGFHGYLRVNLSGKISDYWIANGPLRGLLTRIYIHCSSDGSQGTFDVSSKLAWAGRLGDPSDGVDGDESVTQHVSTLTGKVLHVLAESGSRVTKGSDMLVLESMKMEVRVQAGATGIIEMFVNEKQFVEERTLLCKIHEDTAENTA